MLTNDLKTGYKVILREGYEAFMLDSKKSLVRLVELEGHTTPTKVHVKDILKVFSPLSNTWELVKLTDSQLKH